MKIENHSWLSLALIAILAVAGCSSTTAVQDSIPLAERKPVSYEISYQTAVEDDWKQMFEAKLRDELDRSGLLAPDDAVNPNQVSINFLVFRLRDDASRKLGGLLAGTDEIKSEIVIHNSEGAEIGRSVVTTDNTTAWVTNSRYLEHHARDIAAFISGE